MKLLLSVCTVIQSLFILAIIFYVKYFDISFVYQIGYLQTWLLYHNALSSGVAIEDILKHARKTKENAGDEVSDHYLMLYFMDSVTIYIFRENLILNASFRSCNRATLSLS